MHCVSTSDYTPSNRSHRALRALITRRPRRLPACSEKAKTRPTDIWTDSFTLGHMATTGGRGLCQSRRRQDSTVRSRGLIDLMAELCDGCWDQLANGMAMTEGATAPPCPTPDPDDGEAIEWIEPPRCHKCGREVRRCPTSYERWVDLATVEQPAKSVPEPYRWRLVKVGGPYAPMVVAVRVRALDPLPSDPVIPAHAFLCPVTQAQQVEQIQQPDIRP